MDTLDWDTALAMTFGKTCEVIKPDFTAKTNRFPVEGTMGKLIKHNFEAKYYYDDGSPVLMPKLYKQMRFVRNFFDNLHTCPAPKKVYEGFFVPKEHQSMYPLGANGDIHMEISNIQDTMEIWRPEGFLQALSLEYINQLREYFLGPYEPAPKGVTKMVKRLPYRIEGEETIMQNGFDQDSIERVIVFNRLMRDHGVNTVMWGFYEWNVNQFKEWFEQRRHMIFSKG